MFKELNKNIIIVVTVGLLAALVNIFRLPLFFESQFVFGPCLVLLVSIFRGPLFGLLTSVIAAIPLILAWGGLWAELTFGLEAVFVGLICKYRKFNVILVVMAYWVLIGMPISWYSISQTDTLLDSHKIAILIKQLTNAILYAQLTVLIMYLPITKRILGYKDQKFTHSIKQHSSHMISSLLITLGILFFFFNLNQNINNSSDSFSKAHDSKHEKLSTQLSLIFEKNLLALNEFKFTLSEVWGDREKIERLLLSFNQRHPSYKTMVLADEQADLIASSPPSLMREISSQNQPFNIADREYFQKAINSNDIYVSPGFIGRGFGNDLISAVSVGVPSNPNSKHYLGVVEGSFVLTSLNNIQELINNIDRSVEAVLVDQNNKVLLASESLKLNYLDQIKFVKGGDTFYSQDLVSLEVNDKAVSGDIYYSVEYEFRWGWKLITLQNEEKFADVIENTLIVFAVTIMLVVIIAHVLAVMISHSWSYHMTRLNQLIDRGDDFNNDMAEFEENDKLPEEVSNLYHEIKRSRLKILKMNKGLQDKVAERTEKLQDANTRLKVMANEDALTHLNNRRVFNEVLRDLWNDCQKNVLTLSMIILDIDYFKKVNDSYGHPVGDDILVQVANELNQLNSQNVACVARLGGEEFCYLIKGGNHKQSVEFAEQVRKKIEQQDFHVGLNKTIKVTVSIGVATINPTNFTAAKLYQLADNAMYQAKKSGRNQVKDFCLK